MLDPEQDRHRSAPPASGTGAPSSTRPIRMAAQRAAHGARQAQRRSALHVPAGGEHERGADHALVADRHDRLRDRPPARRAAPAGGAHLARALALRAAGNPGRGPRAPPSPQAPGAQLGEPPALERPSPSRSDADRSPAPARSAGRRLARPAQRARAASAPPPRPAAVATSPPARGRAPTARDRRGPGSGRSRSTRSGRGGSAGPGSSAHRPDRVRRGERGRQLGGGARCCAFR